MLSSESAKENLYRYYTKRDLEEKIIAASKEYSCILITGARQVGKSTVLEQLTDNEREEVSLEIWQNVNLLLLIPLYFHKHIPSRF